MLEHWHPLCSQKSVRRKPIRIELCGRALVVFRTESGELGVLEDRCPHRRMKLSCGKVEGEYIICPYHGWQFDRHGDGCSPGTPRMHATAQEYETRISNGYIWARRAGAETLFPFEPDADFEPTRPLQQLLDVPLELALDNFTEVEHAATVHRYIGYHLSDMHKVRSEVTPTDFGVAVKNRGPQKPVPNVVRWMFGIPSHAEFHWEWETRFSPVVITYDEYWTRPEADECVGVRGRIRVVFVPVNDHSTRLIVFPSFRLPWSPFVNRLCFLFRDVARQMVRYEILQDARMVRQLDDKSAGIRGMTLSRFDRALALHRERIQRIYRANVAQEIDNASVPLDVA